jgi:hypothetical protein
LYCAPNQIAAAIGPKLLFYYPNHGKTLNWAFEFQYENCCIVKSLDWSFDGKLLVGGIVMKILHIKLSKISGQALELGFSQKLPFEPRKCSFSPCSQYIALSGIKHKFVMIWYIRRVFIYNRVQGVL